MNNIYERRSGVWPVMLTPFNERGSIDYYALESLIDWYEQGGVSGLFAVCQSSEMFFLSLTERVQLAKFICQHTKLPVIASGHISYSIEDQINELRQMADTGIESLILITNRLAARHDNARTWTENLEILMSKLDEAVPLGLYECPYPYKRLVTNEEISFCAKSGRFHFLKDTCCDNDILAQRLKIIEGSRLGLYNANTATLLDSLKNGAMGYSGVMANFHPQLYVWICHHWNDSPQIAKKLQAMLSMCSQIEVQCYPAIAKMYLKMLGLPMTTKCRSVDAGIINTHQIVLAEHLFEMTQELLNEINI